MASTLVTDSCREDRADRPDAEWRPDNRFVPLRASELSDALVADAERFGTTSDQMRAALKSIREVLDQEAAAFQRSLEDNYADFNPDRETLRTAAFPDDASHGEAMHAKLAYLLDKANYERLTDLQIETVVRRANTRQIRVRVRPEKIRLLELWVRGHGQVCRRRRTLRRPIKGLEHEVPVFKRMAVVAQLKDAETILIKLFKEIPEAEVEALLPHAEVSMTLLDRLKLFGSAGGALGTTLVKLAKVAAVLVLSWKVIGIVLVGALTMSLRTFFGYKNAKTNRDWQRTQRLYFQNLGNNASALQLLISSVKQEELKEAWLAYAFSLANREDPTDDALRQDVEAYLCEKWDARVDFDVADAVETLGRLDLWAPGATRRCREPADAVTVLRGHWRERRTVSYHQDAAARTARPIAQPAAG